MHLLNFRTCFVILLISLVFAGNAEAQIKKPVFINDASRQWADSVFNTLSYEQKIGQLFMVDAYSNRDSVHVAFIENLIKEYYIGGIIFFQGGPVRQAHLTNRYQSLSKIPLMIGIDGEWGLSMRLDSTIRFPRQMTLGAAGNDSLIYKMGLAIGRECKRMGIHINFAPVADINNNPLNPVINSRSFGEVKEKVTSAALMYMNGLQDQGVMACGKHFPGHGNTDTDSHFSLPVINQNAAEMDTMELFPFRRLINEGLASMMVAHLHIPAYDTGFNSTSTLSKVVTDSLLRKNLGFEGLVFTDALNMKGVANYYKIGELELKALQAGNDVLLYSADIPSSWLRIHYAIQNCEIEQEEIDEKVKRILMAKHYAGLHQISPVDTSNLIKDLNTDTAIYLSRELFETSITVLKNENNIIPLRGLGNCSIASLVMNDTLKNPFQEMILNYSNADLFRSDREPSKLFLDSLLRKLAGYEYVIFSIHNTSTKAASGYGVSDKAGEIINYLKDKVNLIIVMFGNAYTLSRLPEVEKNKSLILAYEDTNWPQYFTAQLIFGASKSHGVLPVTPVKTIPQGSGIQIQNDLSRLRFADPRELGLNKEDFDVVDSLALKAIKEKAAPGCQVLVAWKGNIIYQKSFGTFTYSDTSAKVNNNDLYDIASITKIAATALAFMKLKEEGEVDDEKKASKYFHELRKTNKRDIVIEDILSHRAGLKSWIPFWKNTMDGNRPSYNIYHPEKDVNYSVQVADSLFILKSYQEKLWKEIYDSPVASDEKYVYSDIGMFIMQKVIEEVSGTSLDSYLEQNFYEPLGLHRILFNPRTRFTLSKIVPTEFDTSFRKTLVHGFVHDPAAAMMGGIAGNAGLFSDAYSLAVIMQMLMNGGDYGGKRFLKQETVQHFTSRHDFEGDNRRGLFFDKPEINKLKNGPTAVSASPKTFGHTGFTGTCAWADPENELVYIFLSNRVHPDAENNKLAQGNYRTDIMEAVYQIIKNNKSASK